MTKIVVMLLLSLTCYLFWRKYSSTASLEPALYINSHQSTLESRLISLKSQRHEIKSNMSETSLSEISSEAIRKALRENIESKLNSNNYTVHVSSASKAGENNFIGIVYRVMFNKEDELENVENLILKIAPQQQGRREQFYSRELFLQEIYMYNVVKWIRLSYLWSNNQKYLYLNRFCHISANLNYQKVSMPKKAASSKLLSHCR